MIDDWIDSEQRRDRQSNSIDPAASVGKLPHGFGWQETRVAGGLDNATAGFVLRRLKTRFRWLRGADFLRVQDLSGLRCLDFRPLGVGFLGCFLRRKIDLGPRRGTLNIGPPQARETKQPSRQGRGRTIAFEPCSAASRRIYLSPTETCEADCSRPCFRP